MGPNLKALVKVTGRRARLVQNQTTQKSQRQRWWLLRKNALGQIESEKSALQETCTQKRIKADELDLMLKTNREKVEKYRNDLNAARTNKEYAAILTQINSQKAQDAKLEEMELALMSEIEELQTKLAQLEETATHETEKLETIKASCKDDIEKLDKMIASLTEKRDEAAKDVDPDILKVFERLSERFDGEAMAAIEISGRKPNFTFSCTGCYMNLNAEHVNALRSTRRSAYVRQLRPNPLRRGKRRRLRRINRRQLKIQNPEAEKSTPGFFIALFLIAHQL